MNEKSTILSLIKILKNDHPYGNQLGKEVFRLLSDYVDEHPQHKTFGISLKGIDTTDASFPRESVVALAKQYREDRGFYLQDFKSRDLMDNWNYAAHAKGQPLVVWKDKDFEIIGPDLSSSNRDIIKYVYKNCEVTASLVSKDLKMSVQNASTKLKKLFTEGYILRAEETAESGGKEFTYLAIRPI